jgi:hypothetical protein
MASQSQTQVRLKTIVIPPEHGAWGFLPRRNWSVTRLLYTVFHEV